MLFLISALQNRGKFVQIRSPRGQETGWLGTTGHVRIADAAFANHVSQRADGQQIAQYVLRRGAPDVRQAAELRDVNRRMRIKMAQQLFDRPAEFKQRAGRVALFLPRQEQHFVGQHVFVGHTDIRAVHVVSVWRQMGLVRTRRHAYFQHAPAVHIPPSGRKGNARLRVLPRSRLDHVILFVALNAGDMSVVLDADQQPSAVRIGKSAQRACNLAAIVHFKLEVQLLMLALRDERLDGMLSFQE